MELTILEYLMYFSLVILGVVAHFVKKLANLNKRGILISPKKYFMQYPYQTTLSFIGGIVGYFGMLSVGELSIISAVLLGYACDSIFERDLKK